MKKVVITGKDSYIGNHIQSWLEQNNEEFSVEQLDVITDAWSDYSFKDVDVVVHVAGIVHRPDITDENLYTKVNTDLPINIAKKAKQDGVKQFVFFSTMGVFGSGKALPKTNYVSFDTACDSTSLYGKSKYNAELGLKELEDSSFRVSIVRPPNVYGPHCKGGYITGFTKIVKMLPVVPYAYDDVYQSMIYIDNLCELVKVLIIQNKSGIFMPQDDYDISSIVLIENIAKTLNKKMIYSNFLGLLLKAFKKMGIVRKIYGGVAYTKEASVYDNMEYNVVSFPDAIRTTIVGNEKIG